MIAYVEPNKRFGPVIKYQDYNSKIKWIFLVPAGFRKLKNTILVVEHPDYGLEKYRKNDIIIIHADENKIIPVENFSKENGLYKSDENTRIPINVKDENWGYLYKINKRVGPLVRGYYALHLYCDGRCLVDADSWSSWSINNQLGS